MLVIGNWQEQEFWFSPWLEKRMTVKELVTAGEGLLLLPPLLCCYQRRTATKEGEPKWPFKGCLCQIDRRANVALNLKV